MDVAVLGADADGRGIAQVCALGGHGVALYDEDVHAVMDGIDAIRARIEDAASGPLGADVDDDAADNLEGTTGLDAAVSDVDLVVEATDRSADDRRDLFAEIEEFVAEDALIASSSSTLSVTAVAAGLRQPGRALGLHFVDPPDVPLVEVVVAEQTTATTRDTAVEFVESLDSEPVVVRDVPGFAATRLSLALSAEAMRMVEEEVAGVAAVDSAVELGQDHPIGPLAAADRAGLDSRLEELEFLAEHLGERFEPPAVLREKVQAGALGRKSGEGFYVYEGHDRVEPADPDPTPDLRDDSPTDPDDV